MLYYRLANNKVVSRQTDYASNDSSNLFLSRTVTPSRKAEKSIIQAIIVGITDKNYSTAYINERVRKTKVIMAAPAITLEEMGDCDDLRTWIEYGLKHSKDILGWADFRLTHYEQYLLIENRRTQKRGTPC